MNNTSKTDWDRVDAKSDQELVRDAIADPDNPPIDEEFLNRARPGAAASTQATSDFTARQRCSGVVQATGQR